MAVIPSNTLGKSSPDLTDTPTSTILREAGSEYTDAIPSVTNIRESVGRLPTATVVDDEDDDGVSYSPGTSSTATPTKFAGADPDTLFDALNSYDGWHENLLGNYQNPTYKIRLFMVEDTPITWEGDYAQFVKTVMYDKKQTTIVESGVTGMNISSLTMDTKAAPALLMRSMVSTSMTLNIHEPMGVNLMDHMTSTAKELGIKNYSKAGYFLEIKFQGYEESYEDATMKGVAGRIETNIYKDAQNKGIWLYYVHITEIQSEISSTGSNYVMTLQLFEEIFHQRDMLQIPDSTNPSGDTIGAMLKDFAEKLNLSVFNMYGYQLIEYSFKLKPFMHDNKSYDPKNFKVSAKDLHLADRRSNAMDTAHGVIKGAFQRGTMIHDAVEQMFGASEDAQKLAKDVSVTEVINQDGEKRMRNSVVIRVRPVVTHGEYDFATEQYVTKIKIVILPYFTQVPVLTREQVQISKDVEVQKNNMMTLRKAGYLAKRYDYIFSGINTEVLNFDLKLNMNWTNILPKVMGLNNSMATQASHDIFNKDKSVLNDSKSLIAAAQSRLTEIKDQQNIRSQAATELAELEKDTTLKESEKAAKRSELEAAARYGGLTDSELAADREEALRVISRERPAVQADGNSRIPPVNPARETVKYAEEIEYEQRLTESSKPIPVSTTESNEDTRFFFSGGMPEAHHRDRAIMGAVMDQIYNVKGEQDLQNISLDVRGDPYWLGGGNVMRTLSVMQDKETINLQAKDANDDVFGPNFDKGMIMFLLSFRYPNGVADDGSPILKPHEFFTGLYQVISVTHTFSGGLYHQTLKATRHKLQDIFKSFGVPQIPEGTATPGSFSDVKRT